MQIHKRSIIAGTIGHALEYYDVMLYGFFAAAISPLFFPTDDPLAASLFSLSSFAVGFIMRPIGSIFFGHIGDKLGRRKALMLSIFLVTLPTFFIGILPTYEQIGIAAPIALLTCRLLQGFCLGGEVGGAITYIIELFQKRRAGFASSLLEMSCYLGALFGTSVGFICTQDFMPSWGWRLPFLFGALFGLVGLYVRNRVTETPVFLQNQNAEEKRSVPVLSLLKNHKHSVLVAIGVCMGFIIPFYLITTYTNEILKGDLHLKTNEIMAVNSGLMVLWICLLPLMGRLADKIGIRRIMILASLTLMVVAYPVFNFAIQEPELWKIIVMQVVISICSIMFSAPFCSVFAFLFPPKERYSGSGLSYALGAALFGGTAPLMALNLVTWTGSKSAPAFLLILSGCVGFISILNAKKIVKYASVEPELSIAPLNSEESVAS